MLPSLESVTDRSDVVESGHQEVGAECEVGFRAMWDGNSSMLRIRTEAVRGV